MHEQRDPPWPASLFEFVFVQLDFELLMQNDVEAEMVDRYLVETLEVIL